MVSLEELQYHKERNLGLPGIIITFFLLFLLKSTAFKS